MVLWDEYDPKCPQFHPYITLYSIPKGFKMPRIEPYDGTSDPDDHLRKFYVQMMVYGKQVTQYGESYREKATDAIFCRVFPTTLTGSALLWFFTIPPGSIYNFEQLTQEFLYRFDSRKTTTTTSLSLKQGDDESLKNYVARCKQEAEEADDICGRDYMRLVIDGLKSGSFKESLFQKPPLKLRDLWNRAQLFVDEEHKKLFVDEDHKKQPSQQCNTPGMLHNLFMKMTTSNLYNIVTSDEEIPLLNKI